MTREEILGAIRDERKRQDSLWGPGFDAKNTPNDWIAYIVRYASEGGYNGSGEKYNSERFREHMLKAATLCVAALEQQSFAPRHYDR